MLCGKEDRINEFEGIGQVYKKKLDVSMISQFIIGMSCYYTMF